MRPWLLTIKERIRQSITYLRSLPSSTRKLLSFGGILALVFALPLFILAIVNNRFLILQRAASGEPTPSIIPVPTPSTEPTSTPAPPPTPTANLNPPICEESTIPPATGPAPLTVTLYGAGNAGNGTGFDGYHWDFENNGSWDTEVSINPVTHTYTQPGVYQPVYQIHGTNNIWSNICTYPYQVIALIPTPSPTAKPTATPTAKPTPKPTPIANHIPIITTGFFLPGFYMRNYSAAISGYDQDITDNLQLIVRGLPSGISLNTCQRRVSNSRNEITCLISGTSRQSGLFTVNVTLTDGAGGVVYRNLPLLIIKFPFVNY